MSYIEALIRWLASFFMKTPATTPPEAPKLPVETPSVPEPTPTAPQPSQTHLEAFCTAIMNFEGGPNDPNHTNKNPGDFRCSPVVYMPKYGNVKCTAANFAVFPTFALGWEYLLETVHYRAAAHPTWTLYDFFANYAPSSDGNEPKDSSINKSVNFMFDFVLDETAVLDLAILCSSNRRGIGGEKG